MKPKADRLERLARVQEQLAKALEMKRLRAERAIQGFDAERKELDDLGAHAGQSQPALLPAILRHVAAAEKNAEAARAVADELQQQLLVMKGRENAAARLARTLKDAEARKTMEEGALETALIMVRKASGKRDVLS